MLSDDNAPRDPSCTALRGHQCQPEQAEEQRADSLDDDKRRAAPFRQRRAVRGSEIGTRGTFGMRPSSAHRPMKWVAIEGRCRGSHWA
jgi:hypothetical protein